MIHANLELPLTGQWNDEERLDYLIDLDGRDVRLNDWEVDFVGSCVNKNKAAFSHKQRKVIERLYERFK